MNKQSKIILVVAAHPDDELLGCAGTLARLIKEGNMVHTLILGEGKTARYQKDIDKRTLKEIKTLRLECIKANKIIGVSKVHIQTFPDNKFDTLPLLDIIQSIEKIKENIKPDIIFTHSPQDLNIDHRITYQSVITATRPTENELVKEIYSFEIPSSTEWNYGSPFNPNVFVNIEGTIGKKITALKQYKSEMRNLPHPRSTAGIKILASHWGMKCGCRYAEAFQLARLIK